jgi:glutaredoxin 3
LSEVVIYTKDWCGYCRAAKQLLEHFKVPYEEIDVTNDSTLYDEMLVKSEGRTSVPQIFINGEGIGGYTELYQMAQSNSEA